MRENAKLDSTWIFLDSMKELMQLPEAEAVSDNESFFMKSSVSQKSAQSFQRFDTDFKKVIDVDAMFLMQLLPDMKQLDQEQKSLFKCETQHLLHDLKFSV